MPTYEYHCQSCDRNFDQVQSFHDDPLSSCPTCGSPVRKVFGNVGIVFKGTGFYKTDSRKKSPAKAASSESSSGATAGSESSGSGTDGKAASTAGDGASSTSDAPTSTPVTTPAPSDNGKADSSKSSVP